MGESGPLMTTTQGVADDTFVQRREREKKSEFLGGPAEGCPGREGGVRGDGGSGGWWVRGSTHENLEHHHNNTQTQHTNTTHQLAKNGLAKVGHDPSDVTAEHLGPLSE